jgi:NAD(P)-dependent dehydrogenase (short-subunit alcohol dehydrogenase family)
VRADFADLAQVRALTGQVLALTGRLDALVSNAGIGSGAPASRGRAVSADGYELRFAVNYLAGFALTLGLLPLLRATGGARIVNVASIGQAPIDFDDVMIEKGYSGSRAYGQSKLAQITSGFTLAGLLPAAEVTVNSLHPATYMPTKMVLQEIGHSIDTLARGEAATRRLVSDPALAGVTGRFYDRKTETRAHPAAYDPEVQQRLWELSLDLTGIPDPGL